MTTTLVDEILTDAARLTSLDLDRPGDLVLHEIAGEMARHLANMRRYAAAIARDMTVVAGGDKSWAMSLAASSDSRNYDAAVAGVDALRTILAVAVHARTMAHPPDPPTT